MANTKKMTKREMFEQIKANYEIYKNFNGDGPRFGTGVYGALIGGLPLLFTGGHKLAAGIVTFIIIFALAMIFSGTTLLKLLRSLKTPVEVVGDYAEEKLDSMKETYETVSQDVQEIKAKNAEKRRALRDQQNPRKKRLSIDVPIGEYTLQIFLSDKLAIFFLLMQNAKHNFSLTIVHFF